MISKILQIVLPFWMMARKYTDTKLAQLVGPSCELSINNGVLTATIYDTQAVNAGIVNGTFNLNNA